MNKLVGLPNLESALVLQGLIEDMTPAQVMCRDELVGLCHSSIVATEFVKIFSEDSADLKTCVIEWLDKHNITDQTTRRQFIERTAEGLRDTYLAQLSEQNV